MQKLIFYVCVAKPLEAIYEFIVLTRPVYMVTTSTSPSWWCHSFHLLGRSCDGTETGQACIIGQL